MRSFTIKNLPKDIGLDLLGKHLKDKRIKYNKIELVPIEVGIKKNKEGLRSIDAKVLYKSQDIPDMTVIDTLDNTFIGKSNIKCTIAYDIGDNETPLPYSQQSCSEKEYSDIAYPLPYHEHVFTQFIRTIGEIELKFIDLATIENQRNIINDYFSKKGMNILSTSGILNTTLPINIYDHRSLLEVFAHQNRLCPFYLEKAGLIKDNPIEVMKLTTAYAISKLHLSATQLKPFQPFLGETFQCCIGDTMLYIEQTNHQKNIFHFYHKGTNFKSYGYQEPYTKINSNNITAYSFGNYTIAYPDGTEIVIIPSSLNYGGIRTGSRTFSINNKCYLIDKKNNYLAYINFRNGRERESLPDSFPDEFKGYILRLDQSTYHPKTNSYTLNHNYTSLVEINGNWSRELYLDEELYWEHSEYAHYHLTPMPCTLPSDSSYRKDILLSKQQNNTSQAMQAKCHYEDLHRNDQILRASHTAK